MFLIGKMESLNKEQGKLLKKFLDKLSLAEQDDDEIKEVYIEVAHHIPLVVREGASFVEGIKVVHIALEKYINGDPFYCPEYSIFIEQDESGEEFYYVGEFINHDFNIDTNCVEFVEGGIEVFSDKGICAKLKNGCVTFLQGLVNEGYLESDKICFSYFDTQYAEDNPDY